MLFSNVSNILLLNMLVGIYIFIGDVSESSNSMMSFINIPQYFPAKGKHRIMNHSAVTFSLLAQGKYITHQSTSGNMRVCLLIEKHVSL